MVLSIPGFQPGGESSSLSYRTNIIQMSILSTTYGRGHEFDDIVWDELHGEGHLLKQIENDIHEIFSSFKGCVINSQTEMMLKFKLQQYADSLCAIKYVNMMYEINGRFAYIDVKLPQSVKTARLTINWR